MGIAANFSKFSNNKTSKRIALMMVMGFVLIGGYVVVMLASAEPSPVVQVQKAPSVDSTPGGEIHRTNADYQRLVLEHDQQRLERAEKTGGSAVPTVPAEGRALPAPQPLRLGGMALPPPKNDDMQPTAAPAVHQATPPPPRQPRGSAAGDQRMEQAIAQIEVVSRGWGRSTATQVLRAPAPENDGQAGSAASSSGAAATANAAAAPILPAGEMIYVRNLLEADSDLPGSTVVMAVDTGPLAGHKLLGGFQAVNECLSIVLNRASGPDGSIIPIQAIALEPDSTSPCVYDYVNPRYIERYGISLLADVVRGAAGAAAAVSETVVTGGFGAVVSTRGTPTKEQILWSGVEAAAEGAGNEAKQYAASRFGTPRVTLKPQSGLAVVFTAPVVKP